MGPSGAPYGGAGRGAGRPGEQRGESRWRLRGDGWEDEGGGQEDAWGALFISADGRGSANWCVWTLGEVRGSLPADVSLSDEEEAEKRERRRRRPRRRQEARRAPGGPRRPQGPPFVGGWGVGTEVTPTGKSVSVSVRVVRAGEAKLREFHP